MAGLILRRVTSRPSGEWNDVLADGTVVVASSKLTQFGHDEDEIAPELTGHGLPLSKCEAYNRVYEQFYRSR